MHDDDYDDDNHHHDNDDGNVVYYSKKTHRLHTALSQSGMRKDGRHKEKIRFQKGRKALYTVIVVDQKREITWFSGGGMVVQL